MKLLLNATSPFARFARIVMLEKGLQENVELVWSDPWGDDAYLFEQNPLGRIPTVVTDEDVPICESLLIAEYLDQTGSGASLNPTHRKAGVLHLLGLGLGLMETAFSTVISRKYLNEEANDSVPSRLRGEAIHRTLGQLQDSVKQYSVADELTLGDIAVVVAIDYINFRLPELEVGQEFPELEAWRGGVAERGSFGSTVFE